MKTYVVARSQESAEQFKLANFDYKFELIFLFGQSSYPDVINHVISLGERALIMHDDVVLPGSFCDQVDELCSELDATYKSWGIVSNAGITCHNHSTTLKAIRFVLDPNGAANAPKGIYPAQSVDGNALLINSPVLKEKGVQCPKLANWHFYDLGLSTECIKHECAVLIAHQLFLLHNSSGNLEEYHKISQSKVVQDYLADNFNGNSITTIVGKVPFTPHEGNEASIQIPDLKTKATLAAARLKAPKVAIALITRFDECEQNLEKSINSLTSFCKTDESDSIFTPYIVTDHEVPENFASSLENVEIIRVTGENTYLYQTKSLLFIKEAVQSIDADYIQFMYANNILNSTNITEIKNTISSFGNGKIFFCKCKYLREDSANSEANQEQEDPSITDEMLFSEKDQYYPLSGIIFPMGQLKELLSEQTLKGNLSASSSIIKYLLRLRKDYSPIAIDTINSTEIYDGVKVSTIRKEWVDSSAMYLAEGNTRYLNTQQKHRTHFLKEYLPGLSKKAHQLRDFNRKIKKVLKGLAQAK